MGKEDMHMHICKKMYLHCFFIVFFRTVRLESYLEHKLVRILSGPTTNPNKTNLNRKEFLVNGVDKT